MKEQLKIYEEKMDKTIDSLMNDYASIRAGRANPHVLDKIKVDYYGTPTPIQQVGNISVPEARMILIQPWEKSLFGARNPLYGKHAKNLMKTDVKETGDHYEVDIDLPGFQKDEISVELQNGYLTIQAAKGLDRDQKDQEGRYIRQERYSGTCSRSFYVGDVQPEEINAKYDSGILMLTLPKKDQQTLPTQNRIAIE